ncbi:MAG: GNAT family N-acetyltransferase [Myxococcales bacterium]|nr:GNAT family N-acetyltransferase [Myxococcales bacterium]
MPALDAIVVGGGPAGSAAACVLAQAGKRVAVVERARFPRYHVGESLLPHCYHTLERLGALDLVRSAGFQTKHSVRFVTADGRMSRPFRFQEHHDHPSSQTWQVERATFDRLMLEHAAASGAQVHQETRATELLEEDGRVVAFLSAHPRVALPVVDLPPSARIGDLYVADTHRRRGIGRALVEELVRVARHAGHPRVEVGTLVADARAVAFWRSVGFAEWQVTLARG